MRTQIQMWGNSLAVRIPKAFAADLGFKQNDAIEMSLEDGSLVLRRANRAVFLLDDLLEGITGDNLHEEQDYGAPVGGEVW